MVASEKGVVVGRLTFREDGDLIDCQRMGVGGKAIPPNVDKVSTYCTCCHEVHVGQVHRLAATGMSAQSGPTDGDGGSVLLVHVVPSRMPGTTTSHACLCPSVGDITKIKRSLRHT